MLTEAQKNNLLLAINKAEGFGLCRYTKDMGTQPNCVIGQLAAIHGIPMAEILTWRGKGIDYIGLMLPFNSPLRSYPLDLLIALQKRWDNGRPDGEKEAREEMRKMVEEFISL